MSVSCAVMAHPSRKGMVDELLADLDRPVKVVWDEINDRHDTGIRAVEAYDPSCTHHLVLQDDVVPCRDLLAGVERALTHVPGDVPVSLYVGRVRPFRRAVERAAVQAEGASWITMAGIYWGPAIVLPTAVIDELSPWFRASTIQNYDRRLSKWFKNQGLPCWYTWPSLVDHRGDRSLVRPSTAVRRAHRFLGVDVSALSVDWTGPRVDMDGTERMDRERQRRASQ